MKIAYGQMAYVVDIDEAIANIEYTKHFVDGCLLVYDDTLATNQEILDRIIETGATLVYHRWPEDENVPKTRTFLIDTARKLGYDWIIITDPDERFDTLFLEDLRAILTRADEGAINCWRLNVRDVFLDGPNGEKLDKEPAEIDGLNHWKPLAIKLQSDLWIDGVGHTKNRHEILAGSVKAATLPRQYFYRHTRSHVKVWENAMRNFFVCGSGTGLGNLNPLYNEFRTITDSLHIYQWIELRKYLQEGRVDTRILEFLTLHRSDYDQKWKEELRDSFRWYFIALHPEENVKHLQVDPEPLMKRDTVEQAVWEGYMNILQREPDEGGMLNYVSQIKLGTITVQDFLNALKSSDEYRSHLVYAQ